MPSSENSSQSHCFNTGLYKCWRLLYDPSNILSTFFVSSKPFVLMSPYFLAEKNKKKWKIFGFGHRFLSRPKYDKLHIVLITVSIFVFSPFFICIRVDSRKADIKFSFILFPSSSPGNDSERSNWRSLIFGETNWI